MAPPGQLSIATSSVQRLVKEEASYYKELQQQEARLEKTQASKDEDENAEYQVKQEASPCYSILLCPTFSSPRNEHWELEYEFLLESQMLPRILQVRGFAPAARMSLSHDNF